MLWGVTLSGCGRNDIQVYRVAKEQPQPQAQPAAMPPGHPEVSGAAASRLQWKLPAGWEEAAPGEMRAASFRVKGEGGKQADVGVFPLPGMAGTDLDNVNRWRGQVSQSPVSAEELSKLAQPVQVAGQTAQLYEQAGPNPGSGEKTRILAAILRREDVVWFFKMTGDDALVAQQKPGFIEFLKTVSFPAPVAQTELPPSHPPIGGAGAAPAAQIAAAGAASEGSGTLTWLEPLNWRP